MKESNNFHYLYSQIESPGDLICTQGGSDIPVYWSVYDNTILTPYQKYSVVVDLELVDEGYWNNGDLIYLNTSDLPPGEHNCRLHVSDGTAEGSIGDSIWVTINELGIPNITTKSHTTQDTSFSIAWDDVTDADSYKVYLDGLFYESTTETQLLVEVPAPGTYVITVSAVNNAFETDQSTEITVFVEEKKIPGYSSIIPIFFIGIIILVMILRKRTISS
jgi:hypothetical protein